MPAALQIQVSKNLYLRDPLETTLGKKIVTEGLRLIDLHGFDQFTFKKLAKEINSTEASVYRYFSSKLHFLNYLVSWYWHWVDYIIDIRTRNIADAKQKLGNAIVVLLESAQDDPIVSHIDEAALYRVITTEGARIYLTKHNTENLSASDVFNGYDLLFDKIHSLLNEINPSYPHPRSLTRAIISLAHKQAFDNEFLEGTSARVMIKGEDRKKETLNFLLGLIFSALEPK